MWQMALKDLEQHARALIIFFVSALALPTGFYLVNSSSADNSGFVGVVFGYLVFGAPTLFAFWLVGQEKVKGTLRMIKLLPISGMRIIMAKSITSLSLCLLLNNVTLLGIPLLLRQAGFPISSPDFFVVLWMNLAAVFIVALNIAIFTAFDHKIAMQVAYFGVFILVLAVMAVEKILPARGMNITLLLMNSWRQWYLPYWGGVIVLTLAAFLFYFAGRLFEWTEWPELEED